MTPQEANLKAEEVWESIEKEFEELEPDEVVLLSHALIGKIHRQSHAITIKAYRQWAKGK